MAWCWPRHRKFERWHWNVVARSAHRFGVNIRRGWWAPNEDGDGSAADRDASTPRIACSRKEKHPPAPPGR
jgi:hypothetical protein